MRVSPHVYTGRDEIARLRALTGELGNGDHVALHLDDGEIVRGIVSGRAMLQQYFDAHGREGTNGTVRLEQPALEAPEGAGWRDVWLDRIVEIRRIDPVEVLGRGTRH